MREIIFDTETTGLKPEAGERVIEIGAVEFVNRMPSGRSFHKYINPDGRKVDPGAFAVHGISDEQLADLFAVDPDSWLAECDLTEEYFEQFGDKVPQALRDELAALRARLEAAKS